MCNNFDIELNHIQNIWKKHLLASLPQKSQSALIDLKVPLDAFKKEKVLRAPSPNTAKMMQINAKIVIHYRHGSSSRSSSENC